MVIQKEWRLENGDEVEVNGQVLKVVGVSEHGDAKIIYLSGDFILKIGKRRCELFKRDRITPDMEDVRAVELSSLKLKK